MPYCSVAAGNPYSISVDLGGAEDKVVHVIAGFNGCTVNGHQVNVQGTMADLDSVILLESMHPSGGAQLVEEQASGANYSLFAEDGRWINYRFDDNVSIAVVPTAPVTIQAYPETWGEVTIIERTIAYFRYKLGNTGPASYVSIIIVIENNSGGGEEE